MAGQSWTAEQDGLLRELRTQGWDGWRLVGGAQRVVSVLTRLSGTWVKLENGRVWLADQVEVVEEESL